MTRSMEQLTETTDVTSWVPADSYVDSIMEGSVCYGQLSGVITCVDYDMKACDGDSVQVRYVRKRTAQGPISEATTNCLSPIDQTIGTNTVAIEKFGDYDAIAGFAEFEACGPLRAQIMNEMAKALAEKRDEEIWDQLMDNTPNTTITTYGNYYSSPSIHGSCCSYGFDLYNAIVQAQKHLQGDACNPDYVIMHPDVAQYLYFKDFSGGLPNVSSLVKYGNDGTIISVNGLKVIECCNADCGASGITVAAVIDSSRAVAEAWGKRPTFYSDYVPECDYTKEVIWMYWGTSAIKGTAVAGTMEGVVHIKSA